MAFKSTFRALLTDTLPYEVPVIFSNELLFASLSARGTSPEVATVLRNMRRKCHKFTVPYNYPISKDERRTTALSIVHPNHQIRMSDFYDQYYQSMLDYCGRSDVSLRRPVAETQTYVATPLEKGKTLKTGIPHIDPSEGEIETAHIGSYFAYGKYNLLGKFVDSAEYRGFEKRFSLMRTMDVSKCFFHIYTHSVTWAAKGKSYAKEQGDTYSFESRFDRLMQGANYNETNGIVVGPELSRIFAEIIFQDIDGKLLSSVDGLVRGRDFEMRRYVDDYFLFANSVEALETLQVRLEECLEAYKLFVNTQKTSTSQRPFVSGITLARSDIASLISEMHRSLDDLTGQTDLNVIRKKVREIRRQSLDVRLICERHRVSLSTVSGWLLAALRVLARRSLNSLRSAGGHDAVMAVSEVTAALVDIVFYVSALDMRVRSTFSLCQVVAALADLRGEALLEAKDRLLHQCSGELAAMVGTVASQHLPGRTDSVELYNLLITGSYLIGARFLLEPQCARAISVLMGADKITYFQFITLKFCLLRDPHGNASQLATLNLRVAGQIEDQAHDLDKVADVYLLACDYLSSPDVTPTAKRFMLTRLVGGQPSNAVAAIVGRHLGFVDWTGLRIQHVLARKELRPVYAWA